MTPKQVESGEKGGISIFKRILSEHVFYFGEQQ